MKLITDLHAISGEVNPRKVHQLLLIHSQNNYYNWLVHGGRTKRVSVSSHFCFAVDNCARSVYIQRLLFVVLVLLDD